MLRPVGIGVVAPSLIGGSVTEPFAGRRKKSDWPDCVTPFCTHVARARTCPKLAGMLGRTHVPLGLTETLRFNTLTTQFSFSCAAAGRTTTSMPIHIHKRARPNFAVLPVSR